MHRRPRRKGLARAPILHQLDDGKQPATPAHVADHRMRVLHVLEPTQHDAPEASGPLDQSFVLNAGGARERMAAVGQPRRQHAVLEIRRDVFRQHHGAQRNMRTG